MTDLYEHFDGTCPECDGDLHTAWPWTCLGDDCTFQAEWTPSLVYVFFRHLWEITYPEHKVIGVLCWVVAYFAFDGIYLGLPVGPGLTITAGLLGFVLVASEPQEHCPTCRHRVSENHIYCWNCASDVTEPAYRVDPDAPSIVQRLRDWIQTAGDDRMPAWIEIGIIRVQIKSRIFAGVVNRLAGVRGMDTAITIGAVIFPVLILGATLVIGKLILDSLTMIQEGAGPLIPAGLGPDVILFAIVLGGILVITGVVHELGHLVAMQASDMDPGDMGFVFYGPVPVRFYAEHDDKLPETLLTWDHLRVFAGGITFNVLVAIPTAIALMILPPAPFAYSFPILLAHPVQSILEWFFVMNIFAISNALPLPGTDGWGYTHIAYYAVQSSKHIDRQVTE